MSILADFIVNTPAWVYVLFAYVLWRGFQARRPRSTPLWRTALVPGLLTLWALWGLKDLYGLTSEAVALWLAGLLVGAALGWRLLRGSGITADRARSVLHLPADRTFLPLLLATFAVRYAFGAAGTISPEVVQLATFRTADLLLSGLFTGFFVGRLAVYVRAYQTAPAGTFQSS